jgi:hypothetical protein
VPKILSGWKLVFVLAASFSGTIPPFSEETAKKNKNVCNYQLDYIITQHKSISITQSVFFLQGGQRVLQNVKNQHVIFIYLFIHSFIL